MGINRTSKDYDKLGVKEVIYGEKEKIKSKKI